MRSGHIVNQAVMVVYGDALRVKSGFMVTRCGLIGDVLRVKIWVYGDALRVKMEIGDVLRVKKKCANSIFLLHFSK